VERADGAETGRHRHGHVCPRRRSLASSRVARLERALERLHRRNQLLDKRFGQPVGDEDRPVGRHVFREHASGDDEHLIPLAATRQRARRIEPGCALAITRAVRAISASRCASASRACPRAAEPSLLSDIAALVSRSTAAATVPNACPATVDSGNVSR
jgi:hypothetical protein